MSDPLSGPTVYRSVPVWLRVGQGATEIIYRTRDFGTARASWTPAENQDTFGVPIGGADSPVSGTLVGERYSRQLLEQVIRAGGLPLPPNYAVTDRDDDLMKLVAIGNLPAWDALVVPAANKVGVTVDPGPVAPNSSPGAAGVPSTSNPSAPPAAPSGSQAATPATPATPAAPAEHVETEVTIGGRRYKLSLDALS